MKKLLPLFLLSLAACSEAGPREAEPGVSLLRNFSMAEASAGAFAWRLDADTGRLDEKRGVIIFSAPRVKFFEKDAVSSEITSRSGLLRMREKSAELAEEVEVDAKKDGMRLRTAKLYYSSARAKIWTEEPVTIYKGRTVIKGRGFTANPDLSEIEIQHQETRLSGK
ncbi:MAG: LPS export ABC transporter periplasmic protein LptC [Elusimicrobia bacterium]|nr:LPS export ABC transporter periplasmic protein LptC [Elusimicrobiota bacterium]